MSLKGGFDSSTGRAWRVTRWRWNVNAHEAKKLNLEAVGRFVAAGEEIRSENKSRQQVHGGGAIAGPVGVGPTDHGGAGPDRVRRNIENMIGLSRARAARLIGRYLTNGRVQPTDYRAATQRIPERAVRLCSKREYARLARISVPHRQNLRMSQRYRRHNYEDKHLLKTRLFSDMRSVGSSSS